LLPTPNKSGMTLAQMGRVKLRYPIRYPKSFFKLLAVGFALAVFPLVAGLVANMFAIERLANQSQRAVYDAARVVHATRELSETSSSLERAAQQGVVLQDESLWEGYLGLHRRFVEAGTKVASLSGSTPIRDELNLLLKNEQEINDALATVGAASPQAQEIAGRYAEVTLGARKLLTQSSALIDQEAESLRHSAAETESAVKKQLFLLLPVAIFVVAGFTYLLAKPIAQIEQGIRDLGERRLGKPIEVHGPDDLEQLGHQLDWLRLRLVELEEQKSRFLRNISHDLKTPLTALREGSDLLAEQVAGPLTERQQVIVRILRQHSIELQRLIEELLQHGGREFQQAPIKLQAVKAAEIVQQIANKQVLPMAARGIRLNLKAEEFSMNTDIQRLRVIIDNLISNAVKYSPSGGVVNVMIKQQADTAVIEVIDEGPGVAAEDREHIFDPFYRGQATAGSTVKSSGIGLSIAQEHVLALGGKIDVGTGKGHFTIQLPLNT
jgi:two-component system, NtrC family, sensor histidine kinase GlrK